MLAQDATIVTDSGLRNLGKEMGSERGEEGRKESISAESSVPALPWRRRRKAAPPAKREGAARVQY